MGQKSVRCSVQMHPLTSVHLVREGWVASPLNEKLDWGGADVVSRDTFPPAKGLCSSTSPGRGGCRCYANISFLISCESGAPVTGGS